MAFLQKGFHIGLNNQSAFQSRNVTATIQSNTFVPPTAMENSLYEGKIASPVIPSLHFAYVADRWSISSHFGVPGGGGKLDYENGLPMFDVMVRQMIYGNVKALYMENGVPESVANEQAFGAAGAATVNSAFSGQTYLFGWQVGGYIQVDRQPVGICRCETPDGERKIRGFGILRAKRAGTKHGAVD